MTSNTPIAKRSLIAVVLINLVCIILYSNSLKGTFQFDDRELILRTPYTQNLDIFWENVHFIGENFDLRSIGNRPVLLLSYALNNHLKLKKEFGFHLTNLLLHLLVSTFVFFILLRILLIYEKQPPGGVFLIFEASEKFNPFRTALPFFATLIFAVHPLGTDSVTYISSRSTLLLTLFYLAGVYTFLTIFSIDLRKSIFKSLLLFIGVFFNFCFALFTKLTAATLPATLAIVYICSVGSIRWKKIQIKLTGKAALVTYTLIMLVPAALLIQYKNMDSGIGVYGRLPYLLVQFKAILFYYLKVFLWPFNQNIDIGYPFSTLSQDFLIPLAIILTFALLWYCLFRGGWLLRLSILWVIITLAPTSSFIPLNDIAVEHRLYLPMALGLCPAFAALIYSSAFSRRISILAFILICLSLTTVSRNNSWIDELHIWKDSSKKSPLSARPLNNLGKAYYEKNEIDRAVTLFEKSIKIHSGLYNTHYNLANAYMDLKRLEDAKREYKSSLEINRNHSPSWLGLGSTNSQLGLYKEALKNYKHALRSQKKNLKTEKHYSLARLNIGELYGKMGEFKKAIRQFQIVLIENPLMFKAHYNLGTAYLKLGQLARSANALEECLKINPSFKEAIFNMGRLRQLQGRWEDSSLMYNKFLEIEKNHPEAELALGINAMQKGNENEAARRFKRTLEIDPKNINALVNLGNLAAQAKVFDKAEQYFYKALRIEPNIYQIYLQLSLIASDIRQDKTKALNHLNSALALAPDPIVKRQIRQMIARLSQY